MIFRKIVFMLAAAIPVLLVVFAVLMGGYLVAEGMSAAGSAALEARLLRGLAIACVLLVLVDILLLVPLLALGILEDSAREEPVSRSRDEEE